MTQGSRAPAKGDHQTTNAPQQSGTSQGPLAGVRVLDLTSVLFGPYACGWLADFGADVVKVESPEGDNSRHLEPMRSAGMGALFLTINRNKRGVALDLKKPAGRAALMKLVASADVLAHNMRPEAAKRLGIDYANLVKAKPDLIYASANGFGASGPYAGKPAYDDIIQAATGLADLPSRIPAAPGEPANPPRFAADSIADKVAGLTLLSSILAALYHRATTGEGQQIEVPMFETMAAFNLVVHHTGAFFDPKHGTPGYPRLLAPDRRPFRTKDGWITVLPYSDKHWRAFFKAADRADMLDDPRVNDTRVRSREVASLYAMLAAIMPEKTTAEWLTAMAEGDIPAARVNRIEDVLVDPHLTAIGFFKETTHPSEGAIRQADVPAKFSKSKPDPLRRPAPKLGEHTREVLIEAGMRDAEIDELVAAGGIIVS